MNNRPETGKVRRTRRSASASRQAAIEAARTLLLEQGPQAVTLQSVATSLGMTHGNIAYHFGSSAALRGALVEAMTTPFLQRAPELANQLRRGEIETAEIASMIFSFFAEGGIGILTAWMISQGEIGRLDRLFEIVRSTVVIMRAGEPPGTDVSNKGSGAIISTLIATALGSALIGSRLEAAVGVPPGTIQTLTAKHAETMRSTPLPDRPIGTRPRTPAPVPA